MNPHELIACARALLQTGAGSPSDASVRRAMSTAYYALFHCLARDGADLLIGDKATERSNPAWRQVYRALDHGTTKKRCGTAARAGFPKQIVDFANLFATVQDKRHAADYDPELRVSVTDVTSHIDQVEQAILDYSTSSEKDRRAFGVYVLLRDRTP